MHLLHEVQPDETPVCRGQYSYLRGGKPTGQTETWQITRLPGGAEITRVEVKGSDDATNLLTHLQRDPDGRPEWLRLRYERGEAVAAAQYTFEEAVVHVARQAEGHLRRQEVLDIAAGYEVDYHSVIAHDYVWRGYPRHARGKPWAIPIVSPDLWTGGEEILTGRVLRFNVEPLEDETCTVPAGTFEEARRFEVTLSDGVQAVAWYDEFGITLRWHYPDKDYDFTLVTYTREE
jgi:hypothetical protein